MRLKIIYACVDAVVGGNIFVIVDHFHRCSRYYRCCSVVAASPTRPTPAALMPHGLHLFYHLSFLSRVSPWSPVAGVKDGNGALL